MSYHRLPGAWALALGLLAASPAHADFVGTLSPTPVVAPAALGFSNSTTAGTLTSLGTVVPSPYNFFDTWTFTLAGDANVGGFVGSLNLVDAFGVTTSGIDNLQLRLRGPDGNLVSWTTVSTSTSMGPVVQVFSIAMPAPLAGGSYSLEVRGTLVGPSSAYAGTLNAVAPAPVPVPAALPLLALGLAGLGVTAVRRRA